MLSKTAEHALRATIFLAQQNGNRALSVQAIAEGVGSPQNYLGKTLGVLVRHGIVASSPGRNGGFRLVIAPEDLTIARIVDAVDPPRKMPTCLMGGRPCTEDDPCEIHPRWQSVSDRCRRPIESVTVADLLSGPNELPEGAQ